MGFRKQYSFIGLIFSWQERRLVSTRCLLVGFWSDNSHCCKKLLSKNFVLPLNREGQFIFLSRCYSLVLTGTLAVPIFPIYMIFLPLCFISSHFRKRKPAGFPANLARLMDQFQSHRIWPYWALLTGGPMFGTEYLMVSRCPVRSPLRCAAGALLSTLLFDSSIKASWLF